MECPFCHGSNSDQSRFCGTCGRRLPADTPTAPEPSSPTLGKLRSPLLSGGYEEDDSIDSDSPGLPGSRQLQRLGPSLFKSKPVPEGSNLFPVRSVNPFSSPAENVTNKSNRLRSPLLEPAEPEPRFIPEAAPRQEEYEALRSPLLSAPFNQDSANIHNTATAAPTNASPDTPRITEAPRTPVVTPPSSPATPLIPSIPAQPAIPKVIETSQAKPDTTSSAVTQFAATSASTDLPPETPPVSHSPAAPVRSLPPGLPATSQSAAWPKQRRIIGVDTDETSKDSAVSAKAGKPYAVLALLFVAAVLKIWFISQYWGQQTIVIDQVAQLLVIVSVAGLCLARR